jgi:hypothetical protein
MVIGYAVFNHSTLNLECVGNDGGHSGEKAESGASLDGTASGSGACARAVCARARRSSGGRRVGSVAAGDTEPSGRGLGDTEHRAVMGG